MAPPEPPGDFPGACLEAGRLAEVEARLTELSAAEAGNPHLGQELLVIRIHLARQKGDGSLTIALARRLLAQLPDPPQPVDRSKRSAPL